MQEVFDFYGPDTRARYARIAFVELASDGSVVGSDDVAERLYGRPASELAGHPVEFLEAEEHRGAIRSHLAEGMSRPVRFPSLHVAGGGAGFPVEVTLAIAPPAARPGCAVHCMVEDLTARLNSARELARLSLIAERSHDALISIDLEGRVCHWNAAAERLYGWSAEEATGRRIDSLTVGTDELEETLGLLRRQRFEYDRREVERRRKDGRRIVVSVSSWPWETDGRLRGVTTLAYDITNRREAERAHALLAAVVESTEDAIFSIDVEGRITSWNRGASRMLGYPMEEAIGSHLSLICPPERHPELQRVMGSVARGEPVQRLETVCRRRDGHEVDAAVVFSPMRRPDGAIAGAAAIARDISERRTLEREREQELRDLEWAQRAAGMGSWSWAPDGELTWSAHTYELFDRDPALGPAGEYEVIEHLEPGSHEAIHEMYRARAELRVPPPFEVITTSGRILLIRNYIDETRPGAYAGTVQDVTEERAAERERMRLLEARARAESESRAKSEFLARVSHELRTPLNAIIGFTELLQLDETDPRRREDLGYVLRAGNHLLELINDVLDVARTEANRMSVSTEPVPLEEAVRSTLELVEPLARERAVEMRIDDHGLGRGEHVCADRNRLTQVLLNLLSNAIKYNRRGGRVEVSFPPARPGRRRVAIRDTGHGIPREKLDSLFEPFARLGAEQTEVEGTGLGLTLSRGLVEAMEGTIEVDSEVGTGSVFTIELPTTPVSGDPESQGDSAQSPSPIPDGSGANLILYIEDNHSNFRLVQRLLSRHERLELIHATRGDTGLELARSHRPDLILLDLHLPDMTGHEVLRRLRAENAAVPIVVITADATEGQAEAAIEQGATHFLTKPLNVAAFFEILAETLSVARLPGQPG